MLKRRNTQIALAAGAAVSALAVGLGASMVTTSLGPLTKGLGILGSSDVAQVRAIMAQTGPKRLEQLRAIAKGPESENQFRARYVLATDLLQQGQAPQALELLKGLETQYAKLAPYVLHRQAQAQDKAGDRPSAVATWNRLIQQYPKSPAAAEALIGLGQKEPKYLENAIAQFPSHPVVIDLIQKRLKKNPKQPQLLLAMAKHGLHLPEYVNWMDRLTADPAAAQLSAEDWQTIAFGYWEKQEYAKASKAYARSPQTPKSLYRIARGLQLGGGEGLVPLYQRVINAAPDSDEAGLSLIRLSRITKPEAALSYADQAIARFPKYAGEAVLEKAKIYDRQNNETAAMQTRQALLEKYGKTPEAAEVRWEQAIERAKMSDLANAINWTKLITAENTDSEFASAAGFWTGKWLAQQKKEAESKAAFEQVIRQHPDSYYAWRSAAILGWDVGDFSTVRPLIPEIDRTMIRAPLPAGSEIIQELYQLGLDKEAWTLWQVEFQNRQEPTVAEQYTDGVLRIGVGDYLDGMFMVSYLGERDRPEDIAQYKSLKKQMSFWHSLYPFPYVDMIESWSRDRQVNPLLVTALIRQESRFMPAIRSSVGAVGLMQVMPETGSWVADKIKLKNYKLDNPNDSIKIGTWYLGSTHRDFNDNSMLAVASYNAGPNAVGDWVAKKGLKDTDWFVEMIPYDETRGYVKSVFGNYWNYLRLYNPQISQRVAQVSKEHPAIATNPTTKPTAKAAKSPVINTPIANQP